MKFTKKIIFLLISITLISSKTEINNAQCQKIQCGEEAKNDVCIEVNEIISIFHKCPNGKTCETFSDDPVTKSNCVEKKQNVFKKLPSLPCENNDECLSSKCTNGFCEGKNSGETCESAQDCNYELTCLKSDNEYKCLPPLNTGEKCEKDTDCVNDSGCLNNICTKYFSLENNEYSRDYDVEEFSFCKSGYQDELGKCLNLTLDNNFTECTDVEKCEYFTDEEKTPENKITIYSNCLCGYNPYGKKYCLIGSGNWNYTRYLQKLKDYHLNNKNCHSSERTADGCQKDLLSNDPETLKKINILINSKYWAKQNNKLIDTPDCVYEIELPNYNKTLDNSTEPEPTEEGSCAIYQCDSEKKNEFCAISKYENKYNINVTLSDICPEGVGCKIGGDPNVVFYNESDINAKCYLIEENKRYPGEKCDIDSECVFPLNNPSSQFHKCVDGRCNGMDENNICEDNTWCIAGYFCDKISGKCKEQLKKNENCYETKECKNDLICLNNKCADSLFSLSDGSDVPKNENEEFKKKFCQSMEIMYDKCVSFSDSEKSDQEYQKCNFGSYCKYKVNGLEGEVYKFVNCPCGFNDVGQGYCPHFQDYNKGDWDEYKKLLKKHYDNECHTENRYHCYNDDKLDDINKLKNKLENGHLYYNAVPCAQKVLKGGYLSINKNWCLILLSGILYALL